MQEPLRRDTVTYDYKNAPSFRKHAAQMAQSGWQIGPHTERGKRATVTWFRDVPHHVPPSAFLPPPPRSGLPAIGIVGIVIGALVLLGVIAAAGSALSNTQTKNAAATRSVQYTDADYATLDVRDLKKTPDSYKGQRIQMQGEVFNIQQQGNDTYLQMWVPVPGGTQFDREAVVVRYGGALPNVYEKTKINVFGVGDGNANGRNAFGAGLNQPAIRADRVKVLSA